MKNLFPFLFALLLSTFILSCSPESNNDSPIIDPPIDNTVGYANTVKSIIDGSCINCHGNPTSNAAPMSLTTYNEVKSAVQSRGLIDRIERTAGTVGVMPPSGSTLSASSIQAIKDWQTGGFAE